VPEPPASSRPGGDADSAGIRFPPPFLYAALAALAWWLDARWPLRIEAGGPLELVGAALVVAGLALDLSALGWFTLSGTSPLPFRPSARFVARGPYRLTRNPMYLGMTLLVSGIGLATERPLLAVSALVAALVVDRTVIRREEAYLERRFGADYLDYKRRVRRWI